MIFYSGQTDRQEQLKTWLVEYLGSEKDSLSQAHFTADLFKRLTPLITGGKFLRGILLIETQQILSQETDQLSKQVITAAAALELLQTAFLIHDDIIDSAEIRRGQTTLHHQYHSPNSEGQSEINYGEKMAISAGDLLFLLGLKLVPAELKNLFSQQLSLTTLGQMLDVRFASEQIEAISIDQIKELYLEKTSSYSTCLPLMAGAQLAGADQSLISQLNQVGQELGLIFQIIDDQLGLFSNQEQLGKSIGVDIKEGKKTLHYKYLSTKILDANNLAEQVLLTETFGNKFSSDEAVKQVLSLFEKYQISTQIDQELAKLSTSIKNEIKQLSSEKLRNFLLQFLSFILQRRK